jgi:hypothetical protein
VSPVKYELGFYIPEDCIFPDVIYIHAMSEILKILVYFTLMSGHLYSSSQNRGITCSLEEPITYVVRNGTLLLISKTF